MPQFNCRLVERNGSPVDMPWMAVGATNEKSAAAAYCDLADVWDRVAWEADDSAVVEVEMFGGESGMRRMDIGAYTVLQFSATPLDV